MAVRMDPGRFDELVSHALDLIPQELAAAPRKRGGHRAMDDVKESVAELAFYRQAIFRTP
jgi:oligoribonuclease (3'-5' exoribonuclease)